MYDENDGWFDHVAPPTAPAGTPDEYLTATPSSVLEPGYQSQDLGISGPLGLGVRVPALMISPFSRGGGIVSEVFDHTSQLKLAAESFNVEVPNVSAWRMATVGDLTSAVLSGRRRGPATHALSAPPAAARALRLARPPSRRAASVPPCHRDVRVSSRARARPRSRPAGLRSA